ncbi:MDR family MFS transporter [Streptomyces sp. TRM 70361]|uniref:MDR family MFS transporter n=1 Tax=Streptomyces sp. TRM 70361 TaxID=3116553 RepID=UPI002E7B346E|nr:MDR family MFS transporter [Streptomyces sp. TRM 70361]MEE1939813.1 MDR family MFS transporter [Streptomyces sp. TRM 70361]
MPQHAPNAAAPPTGPGAGQPRRAVWPAIGALLLGMLLGALDQTIVATALPTIASDLGGLEHLSWVITAYLLAATAATPLWGKLGDQYGRRRLYQLAILVFLAGSVLCGLARNMPELIAFRAVQGLGGGGLMVLSMAIVGDLVPPRDRGRYQGAFGGVFAATSVLGPLLGGLLTEYLDWRWVFYVNLPVGAVALAVAAATLRIPARRGRHRIDYLGTLLIASVAACVVLVTSLGGTAWAWGSALVIGLGALGAVLLAAFAVVERRAAEPVLPPGLFRVRTFTICSAIGFVVGFALFGALAYLPTFLQVVHGISPTMSGVHLLPMVLGVLVSATGSGRIVSRTGRWKVFPLVGTAVTAAGLLLLHGLDENSTDWRISVAFLVFGLGLGLVMQVLILAVQNAVPYEHLGVATSGATFFRSIGAAVGVSVFGSLFAGSLADRMAGALRGEPLPPGVTPEGLRADPRAVGELSRTAREKVLGVYSDAITDVFLWAVPVVLVAFVLAWFLEEEPLRTGVRSPDPSEVVPPNPVERSSLEEAARVLSLLGSRQGRRDLYRRVAERAGTDLAPASCWMLLRVHRYGSVEPALLADRGTVPLRVITAAARELEARGLAAREGLALVPTGRGRALADRLAGAREECLAELLGDWWTPGRPTDLAALVHELSEETGGTEDEYPRAGTHRKAGKGDWPP